MKRRLPKALVDKAKTDLRDVFISRIIKNVNEKGCWHLKSADGSKIVDFLCHFSEKGTKKIFFKAKRFSFECFNGDLAENFAVYSSCSDKYCVNPSHHYAATTSDYLRKLTQEGKMKRRSGFKHSPKTIAKMSQTHTGKKPGKEARLKMRRAKLGVARDPELVARVAEQYFQGEKNARAKLTEQQVLEIRELKNITSSRELAKRYPVTHSHVRSIWGRKCWTHL